MRPKSNSSHRIFFPKMNNEITSGGDFCAAKQQLQIWTRAEMDTPSEPASNSLIAFFWPKIQQSKGSTVCIAGHPKR